MLKVFLWFALLCIPLVWFYAEYENTKPEIKYYEIVEPESKSTEPETKEPIIEIEPNLTKELNKNEIVFNASEQNSSMPVNKTQNQTQINETNITLPYLPQIGILNQQNSQKAVNNIDYINKYWNIIVFYTDSACYIRINPNLNEKDWIYYITTFDIPLHYQMDKKYCHLIQTNF